MLGVDVGGTFTDVVSVRDGRIEVTKVPSSPGDPAASVIEGARRLGVEGQAVFNHASTMGLNAVITRDLPKIAFLTTEGHRDILDRGRIWRPPAMQTDPSWRRSFGDAARPLVPRYLRRGVAERLLADGSVHLPLDEEQARGQLAVLERCDVEGVAICLLNAYVNPVHERAAARADARGARRRRRRLDLVGDLAAREGVRARVDDGDRRLHEADLHRVRAPRSTSGLREARLHRRSELRRLRGHAPALERGAREAVPDRLRRPGCRDDVEHAAR